jgi:2-polyprenyl-3-methyl-5-hydroxy-6-metoxy-1,4-benzoquinol methylase
MSDLKNISKILPSQWPDYIDPKNGEKLIRDSKYEDQLYLKSVTGKAYPIINDIPRILDNVYNYSSAFGEQWMRWRKTQLDSYTQTTISQDRLTRCLGISIMNRLKTSQEQLNVLEVGCGAGRFTEILLNFPSIKLTSIDLSAAVDANSLNFPQSERHRIIQTDIMEIPFKPMQYDIVICLGVVQHTPNPEITIKKLYEQVKPGCDLVIDHYTFDISRFTKFTGNALRPIIKRLSTKNRMNTIKFLVDIFFPLHKAIRKFPILQKIFSRISPILTYFHAYPELSDDLQKEWSMLDTHDGLTDWYKHLRTLGQIKKSLQNIKSNSIEVWLGGNGVEARCKRPLNQTK